MKYPWSSVQLTKLFVLLISCTLISCSEAPNNKTAQQADTQHVNENNITVANNTEDNRPNIVLIVADDLGYADLGAFGAEIDTPNLDALANKGMKLTNFYTAPTCSPTRSMLMSGTDNHLAGLGSMAEFMRARAPYLLDKPGYQGYLNHRVASFPEVMSTAGYQTLMVGKWHLGKEKSQRPAARGFQRSFSLLDGGSGHFNNMSIFPPAKYATYLENDQPVTLPDDFYSTTFYTEKMRQYITQRDKSKPFISYLSYTAPHWPLQAPEQSIAKYKGKYDAGYEVLLANRIEKQKELGLIPKSTQVPRLPDHIKPWHTLTDDEKKYSARKMEIYAAMVSDLDHSVGTLINDLKSQGLYDNTIIFFMSDNGAEYSTYNSPKYAHFLKKLVATCCDNSLNNMGKANSYVMYGAAWARAGSGLNRFYKGTTSEGGIHTPAFIHFPKMIKANSSYKGFTSVMDFMPTFLDIANIQHPAVDNNGDEDLLPMRGESMLGMLQGLTDEVHQKDYAMGWELFGDKSIRRGDWKLVLINPPLGSGQWALYNLAEDPAEQHDLSLHNTNEFKQMQLAWQHYVNEVGVQPLQPRQ